LPDELIEAIRPAPWGAAKIEGIDLKREFRWIDDNPDQVSLDGLERAGLSHCWVDVSTDRQMDDLERVITNHHACGTCAEGSQDG
jgi:hypothetical protein